MSDLAPSSSFSPDPALFRGELLDRKAHLHAVQTRMPQVGEVSRLLQEIDDALGRLTDGSFGLCTVCHDPIEADRLRADPLTTLCLDHLTPAQARALEGDLELAVRIQTTLLPARHLSLGGWDAAFVYEPAAIVSGDYCDFISTGGNLVFLVADVSGKGVAASLLMSHLHAIFHTLVPMGLPLTQLLEHANRVFCESTLPSHYATMMCGRATPTGDVEVCNAGHCPPIVVRDAETEIIAPLALPLGFFADSRYSTETIRLAPRDTLLLYTDGLTEALDASGTDYGVERLKGRLEAMRHEPVTHWPRLVLEDLAAFRASGQRLDDVTVMALRRRA
jgi:sigma-B regulation protein RsbU (phosphoserine phosphatase)